MDEKVINIADIIILTLSFLERIVLIVFIEKLVF